MAATWYVKVRRAMNPDDFERWEEGVVCPTLNVADNTGDVRATVVVTVMGNVTHALTHEGHDASEDGTGRGTPIVNSGSQVRRLTPRECERLQSFPDDWSAGQADSHRYKQMGNAVTVNVAHYVATLINDALAAR